MFDKIESFINYDILIAKKINLSKILLASGIILDLIWAVYFMFAILNFPHQLSHLEGTANVQTWLLLKGLNPFSLENQPLGATNYGIVYSLIVLPFAALFGNTLLVHRAVTFVFIFLSALLGFFTVYSARKSYLMGFTCSVFIVVSLGGVQGLGGISAFPSATGAFFFLATILIPFLYSFDNKSLLFSIVTALIAFYTKPYFLLAIVTVTSYTFFYVSIKKGLFYGLFALTGIFLSILVVKQVFPLYFVVTFWGNVFNTTRSFEHLLIELQKMITTVLPLLLLALLIVMIGGKKELSTVKNLFKFNVSRWNEALFEHSLNYLLYSLGVSMLAFVFVLGWHALNDLGYAYQLVLPLFFCLIFREIVIDNKVNLMAVVLILFNLFLWQKNAMHPEFLRERSQNEWSELFGYINGAKNILHPPLIVAELMPLGFAPMDSGQTIMFYNIQDYPQTILTNIPFEQARRDGYAFTNAINRRIEKRKYDVAITVEDKAAFFDYWTLQQNYTLVDEIEIEVNLGGSQVLQIWEPIP